MNHTLDATEAALRRELAEIGPLLDLPASSDLTEWVKGAALREATLIRRRKLRERLVRPWIGVAAALLLLAVWKAPLSPAPLAPAAPSDPDAYLEGWQAAADLSGERVTMLFDDARPSGGVESSETTAPEDTLDGFEKSLDFFEQAFSSDTAG